MKNRDYRIGLGQVSLGHSLPFVNCDDIKKIFFTGKNQLWIFCRDANLCFNLLSSEKPLLMNSNLTLK